MQIKVNRIPNPSLPDNAKALALLITNSLFLTSGYRSFESVKYYCCTAIIYKKQAKLLNPIAPTNTITVSVFDCLIESNNPLIEPDIDAKTGANTSSNPN